MLSLYILHLTLLSFVEKDFITHLEKLIAYWELFSETTFGFESRKLFFILKTLISNLLLKYSGGGEQCIIAGDARS